MIDAPNILRDYLLTQSGITDLTTTSHIWAERVVPIPGYAPAQGPAICFRGRGGLPDYSSKVWRLSFVFKLYGLDEETAQGLYRAWVDSVQDAVYGRMRHAAVEIAGQTLREPAPLDWPFVLTFLDTRFIAD